MATNPEMLQVAQGSVGKPLPRNLNDNQSATDEVAEVITLMDDDDIIDVETYKKDFSHQVLCQARWHYSLLSLTCHCACCL